MQLFDYLVGQQLQRVGYLDAEQSRRLRVDDKLEFCRLHDRQVGRLRPLEDLTGVNADLTIHPDIIGPIAHQPAGFDFLAKVIGRGNPMMRRKRRKLDAPADEECVGSDDKGLRTVTHEGGEGCLDLAAGAGLEDV